MRKSLQKPRLFAIGAIGLMAIALSSCKMPPKEVWRQIQSEGLVRYMAAAPLRRQMDAEPQGRARSERVGSTEYLAGYGFVAAENLAGEPPEAPRFWTDRDRWEVSPFATSEGRLITARPIPERHGYVISPHARGEVVDVRQFSAGQEVRCPHSGLSFLVPRFPTLPMVVADTATGRARERLRFESPVPPPPVSQQARVSSPQREPISQPRREKPEVTPPAVRPDGLVAERVPGKQNLVFSPYATRQQQVDITGLVAGDQARCPYTNRVFVVPAPGIAAPPSEVAKISNKIDFRVLGGRGDPQEATERGAASAVAPTAVWAARKGYVTSPFGGQLVDVSGKAAGSVVRCPFSGKLFRVPPGSN